MTIFVQRKQRTIFDFYVLHAGVFSMKTSIPFHVARRGAGRRRDILLFLPVMLAAISCSSPDRDEPRRFDIEVMNGYTPVKDQGGDPTCYAYAMLAAIETEHIMRGDSVNLSVKYAVRSVIKDNLRRYYFTREEALLEPAGTGHTLLRAMARDGVVEYDAYRDYERTCYGGMTRQAGFIARQASRGDAGYGWYMRTCGALIDETMGTPPQNVYFFGMKYSPEEFARSVCAPDEYVALTSFSCYPLHEHVDLPLPHNHARDTFYNLTLDELMDVMTRAVRQGHGVCWEGDITEPLFSFAAGVARLPAGTVPDETGRREAYERRETTDDHCMAVIGMARDDNGEAYFIMKNSWGTDNPYGGLMYVSADYVRMKTVAVYLPAAACE